VRLVACFIALGISLPISNASSIASDVPGNLFVEGTSPSFTITAEPNASYNVIDFWSRSVASGEVATGSRVSLPKLSPGWYALSVKDTQGTVATSFGVVFDRHGAPLPIGGRIAADAASAWLLKKEEQRLPFAKVVATAGIPWVRERTSWAAVEQERGKFNFGAYDSTTRTLHSQGVHVLQMWHDSPKWAHPGRAGASPDDLRDVYNWTKTASTRYRSEIEAWEVWNEQDATGFWAELGDRFAALQKAAYWGIKDGSPKATILLGGIAGDPARIAKTAAFLSNIYESGVTDYYDKFNFHYYDSPSEYSDGLAHQRTLLRTYGNPSRPAWLTEAGIHFKGSEGENKHLLSMGDQRSQALFVGKSAALSLAAGTERHFFFVLPDYLEDGNQFGALKPDLTPYPSLLALSAAANILGEAKYAGSVNGPEGATVLAFSTPTGPVLAAWSKQATTLRLPPSIAVKEVLSIFGGTAHAPSTPHDVALSDEVAYIRTSALPPVELQRSDKVATEPPHPSRTVLAGFTDLTQDRDHGAYIYESKTPFQLTTQVYNFDASKAASGKVTLNLPNGWTATPKNIACNIAPMGREVFTFTINPNRDDIGARLRIAVIGDFSGDKPAPSVSYFRVEPTKIPVSAATKLSILPASLWDHTVAPNGNVDVTDIPDGVRIAATFTSAGDRWVYPAVTYKPYLDLSRFDGISFDVRGEATDPRTVIRMMVVQEGGTAFMMATPLSKETKHCTFLFSELEWGNFSAPSKTGRLDPSRIEQIKFGANTSGDTVAVEISNVKCVALQGGIK
jgi:hypothetical protein